MFSPSLLQAIACLLTAAAAGPVFIISMSPKKIDDTKIPGLLSSMLSGISSEVVAAFIQALHEEEKEGRKALQLAKQRFSASQLLKAGFRVKELKEAGYDAKQLKEAGLSAKELKQLDFSARELIRADSRLKQLMEAGFPLIALLLEAVVDYYNNAAPSAEEVQVQTGESDAIEHLWARFDLSRLRNGGVGEESMCNA